MTPDLARSALRRQLAAHGEPVTITRGFGGEAPITVTGIRIRIMNYTVDHLTGGVHQGERKAIVLAEDIAATVLGAPVINDRIGWNGKNLVVKSVDDATRRVAGVVVGYELKVAGA